MLLGKLLTFLKSEDPLRAGGARWGRTTLLQGGQMAKQEHFWQLTTLDDLVLLSGFFILGTSRRCHHVSGPTTYIETEKFARSTVPTRKPDRCSPASIHRTNEGKAPTPDTLPH